MYSSCRLCPHSCAVDRRSHADGGAGELGVCGETSRLRLAVAGLHFGEEPPLTGKGGSGTIFVSGCAMRCPFCQNFQLSRCGMGREVGKHEFVLICEMLRDAGAENINLVTPSHMAPTLIEYLSAAKDAGIMLPVAWNSSGFESTEVIAMAADLVDFWLPDLKTISSELSQRRYGVRSYAKAAKAAVLAMVNSAPMKLDDSGDWIGVTIVRHLVLPGELDSTRELLEWFADTLSGRAALSLMTQYTPVYIPGESRGIPDRPLSETEYAQVLSWLEELNIEDGFVQELVTGSDWLPDFRKPNPFGSDLSRILWNWDPGVCRT